MVESDLGLLMVNIRLENRCASCSERVRRLCIRGAAQAEAERQSSVTHYAGKPGQSGWLMAWLTIITLMLLLM